MSPCCAKSPSYVRNPSPCQTQILRNTEGFRRHRKPSKRVGRVPGFAEPFSLLEREIQAEAGESRTSSQETRRKSMVLGSPGETLGSDPHAESANRAQHEPCRVGLMRFLLGRG